MAPGRAGGEGAGLGQGGAHVLQDAVASKAALIRKSVEDWSQSKGALMEDVSRLATLVRRLQGCSVGGAEAKFVGKFASLQGSSVGDQRSPSDSGFSLSEHQESEHANVPFLLPPPPVLASFAHRPQPQTMIREGVEYEPTAVTGRGECYLSDLGSSPPSSPSRALADTGKQELLEDSLVRDSLVRDFNRLAHLVNVLQHRSEGLEHVI
jgi:hypothetical protein